MSNVPPSKREQHLAKSGVELKSDDTQLDVAAWREAQATKLDSIEALIIATNAALAGTLIARSSTHENVHLGKTFLAFHNSSSLANGSNINIFFETSATTSAAPHIVIDASGSLAFQFEVLEGPTVTSGTGTSQSVFNKNRQSATTSLVYDNASTPVQNKMSIDVTVTADGTVISDDYLPTGKSSGGILDFGRELILKASTKYVFRLTSLENNNICHINLDWYEP
ncbi:MAG: hypothetical protein CO099_06245 [Bdellovibrio sp. CG_4_9_14_3_um_filter_39_7]|nr:MAG: hypothetical protein CO099_06245 [Bdellovibrio sp. CG_4_9_14_3_um_filter_39_7]